MVKRFWCWLLGHDWTYLYSFTAGPEFLFGGFRIRCACCSKSATVKCPENMEIRRKGDG